MDSLRLLWVIFGVVVVVVCALDLLVVTRRTSPLGVGPALRWTGIWVAVALGFGAAIFLLHPGRGETAVLFIAGYLTEYSLSVDNLFVFLLIFSLMGVRAEAQPKLIKLGIYLSIVLRVIFILFGIALVQQFHWLIYLFGLLLIWTAWKMISADENEHVNPESNLLYKIAARCLPVRSEESAGTRLVIRSDGRWYITPLFLVFLVIGSTDVLFALDSIPAIMGISQDPFVVVTSNIFAVLGLNSLFFALRGVMGMFKFLKHGVSVILLFIGVKMIAGVFHPVDEWFKANPFVSLIVIVTVLLVSIILSIWHTRLEESREKERVP